MLSPSLTSFESTLFKWAKNSSVPSAMVSLIIGTSTSMTEPPPGGKVKVCETPVKSAGSIQKEVCDKWMVGKEQVKKDDEEEEKEVR